MPRPREAPPEVRRAALALLLTLFAGEASAQSVEPRETPEEEVVLEAREERPRLRPLSPDRPDVTESPHTVDQGHFQLEMDMLASERDAGAASLSFAVSNLKIGVTSFLDLQLVLSPLVSTPPATEGGARGFGYADPVTRVKVALYGNDGGPFALGALGFVRVPVHGSTGDVAADGSVDRAFEGGVAIPASFALPFELELAAMVELDVARNAALDGHHLEVLGSLSFGRHVAGPLSAYVEGTIRGVLDQETSIPVTVNVWVVYEVHESFVLDAGAYVGVTRAAPDVVSFVGTTLRI